MAHTTSLRAALFALLVCIFSTLTIAEQPTPIHEPGRCAIRGQCGKKTFFGKELPCPDNGLAEEPTDDVRQKLVELCGEKWSSGPVCCEDVQIDSLKDNLKTADKLISSCPACRENFFNLFCTFTCSPDQSTFINVTNTLDKGGKTLVTEMDVLINDEYSSGFYDSCKEVKFGPTNGRAMDLLGGGAKNYSAFLKYLGDEKFIGSPFQINFPHPEGREKEGMVGWHGDAKACNDKDERYRCPCVDCPDVCLKLPKLEESESCHVGYWPCFSFGVVITYASVVLALAAGYAGYFALTKQRQLYGERLRLLQDAAPSDDEDEGDIVHSAGALDNPERRYALNTWIDGAFNKLGKTCASFPASTIALCALIVAAMSLGWSHFAVETDPVRLWVAPSSAAAEEKAFFDANFGPFFRSQQAFLVNDTTDAGPAPVLSYDTLDWWFGIENQIKIVSSAKYALLFDDVCYKPDGKSCVVQSVSGYWDNGGSFNEKSWKSYLTGCVASPAECLPDFSLPLQKNMVLGPPKASTLESEAIITTWVVSNHPEGSEELDRAMDWERTLKDLLLSAQADASARGLRLSFSTEISLEQELNKSTNTDAKIVVISYIIMFIYASLALGSASLFKKSVFNFPSSTLIHTKFTVGIVGILIVLMSVSASVGLFSAMNIKVTLIIAEVIPFLVLAVGVDNIFLIVHEFDRVNASHPDEKVEDRLGRALGRMGPSILLSASIETVAFALGAFVSMPAVRNFAVYAAGAVVFNAILQVTMFISVLALDQKRVEARRADCFPCIRIGQAIQLDSGLDTSAYDHEGFLQDFIRSSYAPTLLKKKVKIFVVTAFLGIFAAGLALIPTIELGLDQRIAIPSDSYLINYFTDLYDYFGSGPPVYFVTRDLNLTQQKNQRKLCGHFGRCEQNSLANVLEEESRRPEVSYINTPTANWIDDFLFWLNPLFECCTEGGVACFENRHPPWNSSLGGMPEGEEFIHWLKKWIEAPSGEECPFGGKAPYSNALVFDTKKTMIPASHFRSTHKPLRSQADFINAYASARRIADSLSEDLDADIFPYSIFYIFFDQYASIARLTGTLLGAAFGIILLITTVLLGSFMTGLVVSGTVAMIVVDIMGAMVISGVSLNALSLVNLVICVGIGVEFCAHVARAFMFPSRNIMERGKSKFRGRDARVWAALVNVGGSVFSGITITKLLGISVLAFTRSKIFEIYYFRVWLALVILASTHALIFLPVALSLFGGKGYVDFTASGGLEEDLAARRYRALMPDEEYDSDDY